jgi:hypothetical protein
MNLIKGNFTSVIILVSLFISIFINEWVYGRADQVPVLLRQILYFIPFVMMFMIVLKKRLFFRKNKSNTYSRMYSTWAFSILFIVFFRALFYSGDEYLLVFYFTIVQALLFGYAGYWLIRDIQDIHWILDKIAIAGVIVGYLEATVLIAGIEAKSIIFPSWPLRLFVLFGYCWYLTLWLKGSEKNLYTIIALIGCTGSLLITFHKPIIFATSLSTISLFYYYFLTEKKIATLLKVTGVFIGGAVLLITLNTVLSGNLFDRMLETYYDAFLRVEQGTSITQLQEDDLHGVSGGRFEMWPIAIDIVKDNIVFGTGERQLFQSHMGSIHIHNWFLELLIWGGLIGALPFFIGFLWWFKIATTKKNLKMAQSVLLPALAFTIGITAYNLGGSMFTFTSLFSFVMLIIAVTTRYIQNSQDNRMRNLSP